MTMMEAMRFRSLLHKKRKKLDRVKILQFLTPRLKKHHLTGIRSKLNLDRSLLVLLEGRKGQLDLSLLITGLKLLNKVSIINVTYLEEVFKKSDKKSSKYLYIDSGNINKLPLVDESSITDNIDIPNLHFEESPQKTVE